MAGIEPLKVHVELSDELGRVLQETISEERIRAIVREELVAYEKRQVRRLGLRSSMETK